MRNVFAVKGKVCCAGRYVNALWIGRFARARSLLRARSISAIDYFRLIHILHRARGSSHPSRSMLALFEWVVPANVVPDA